VVRVIIFGILLLFELPIHVDKNTLLLLLGMGTFEIATIFTYMKMHEYNELSVSSIAYRARLIFTPILDFFLKRNAYLTPIHWYCDSFFGCKYCCLSKKIVCG